MPTSNRSILFVALLAVLASTGGYAADEPGSTDHPLVGRFEGSEITFYKSAEFDETALLQGAHDYGALLDRGAIKDRSGQEWLHVAGRITKIRYAIPAGRSSLEVMRNFADDLRAKGFSTAFSCTDQDCLTGSVTDPYVLGQQIDTANVVSTAYFDHARYMLASASRPEGTVHVSVLTGEDKNVTTAFIEVAESKAPDSAKASAAPPSGDTVEAAQMETALARDNKVDLRGIYFDFNSDAVKGESAPTLTQIATLMKDNPGLRLRVVGHTDNVGTPDYNLGLSTRRASNVLATLVTQYGVAPDRLSSSGAGQTEPVASNDNEGGRALNRRVELRKVD